MKKLLIYLFLFTSVSLFAQDANTKHMMIFDDCQLEDFKSKVDEAPEFMGGLPELNKYFTTNCTSNSQISTLNGKVFVQVLIDNSGKPCCRQIANKTGEDISILKLKELINEMPVWKAAIDEGIKVNYSAFLILSFSDGKCTVTYNKSVKHKEKKEYNIPYYSIEEALKYVDIAKTLNLTNKGLKELDPVIGKLVNLTELNLGQNQLKTLPKEIGSLSKLEFLYLPANQLESLPSQIGNLTNLKGLILKRNQLKSLPKDIGKLKNLRMINISDNKISEKEISRIKKLLPDCNIIQ